VCGGSKGSLRVCRARQSKSSTVRGRDVTVGGLSWPNPLLFCCHSPESRNSTLLSQTRPRRQCVLAKQLAFVDNIERAREFTPGDVIANLDNGSGNGDNALNFPLPFDYASFKFSVLLLTRRRSRLPLDEFMADSASGASGGDARHTDTVKVYPILSSRTVEVSRSTSRIRPKSTSQRAGPDWHATYPSEHDLN